MTNSVNATGICLYALPAREEAVLKRVISFSSTQGRNYVLAEAQAADMLVLSDDTTVDPALMNPAGCLLVRIADAGTAQAYDVLMQRPLLVTKVMRTLDQAKAMLPAADTAEIRETPVDTAMSAVEKPVGTPSVEPVAPAPKPAMSLYAQIMGGGAAKNAMAQQAESKPTPEPEKPSVHVSASNTKTAEDTVTASETVDVQARTDDHSQSEPETAAKIEKAETVSLASDTSGHPVTDSATPPQGMHHLALVVDDSAAIRKQLELELRAAGIGAEFAETGEEALEKVAAKRYDLIFLDIIMPGIDGYETCRQMRLRADLKKTPIIMLSAKTSPLDEVQGVIAGASTYLTKPVKSDQLQQTLKRVSMWLDNFQVSA